MTTSLLDQLIGLTAEEVDLLKTLSRGGAATAEEVALRLNRAGDDLTPLMNRLVQRKLLEIRTISVEDETFDIYLVDPLARKTFKI